MSNVTQERKGGQLGQPRRERERELGEENKNEKWENETVTAGPQSATEDGEWGLACRTNKEKTRDLPMRTVNQSVPRQADKCDDSKTQRTP